MALITCQNISKSYGMRDLFEGVSFLMDKSSRKALIGDNGAGKSTIMKILAGELAPDSGRVLKETGVSVGYLPQDSGFDGDFELVGSVACASPELAESYARLRSCRERLDREPDSNSAAAELGDASHEFEALGGFGRLEQARIVLLMLGFLPEETELLPRHLSGGQKTRAHLARLLLGEHDLLLLDEPTNHLDIDACERFVEYLNAQYQGSALIISHDRYFLDQICDSVLALEGGCVSEY
ncbi:MAG: ABC-F family ATP-binding cassette domain-containing protein, partial [Abditibacteriota bacterium]|nr:ABC-F family ATP-binding cassette domain-containing protein [Abditibacteriota bacterium]